MAPLADDEEEFTELVAADFPRVDLVSGAANGHRVLIATQDEASAGLLDPEFVRSLIGKQADPEPPGRERVQTHSGITVTGSPADIAAFIHKAAERADDYEQVCKEKYSAADRKKMVGSGDRSEKIRTYNFPQSRVSDHRIGFTSHRLGEIMDGRLDELIDPLVSHFQAEKLKEELAAKA